MKRRMGWAVMCMIVASSTIANAANISRIKIVEYGIFEAHQTMNVDARDTSVGFIHISDNLTLVKETNTIFADIGTRFGIRYTADGDSDDSKVEILVKVLHPRTVNPRNNKEVTLDQWSQSLKIGEIAYSGWTFDEAWEIVPGEWIIQLWHADRKLAERSFTVRPKN